MLLTMRAFWYKLILKGQIMTKTAPATRKKGSLKPPSARKRAAPPFAGKIPFIPKQTSGNHAY